MSDYRFYIQHHYVCPECRNALKWEKRPGMKDSLMLVHDKDPGCSMSDKKFYAPVQALTEIPTYDGGRP